MARAGEAVVDSSSGGKIDSSCSISSHLLFGRCVTSCSEEVETGARCSVKRDELAEGLDGDLLALPEELAFAGSCSSTVTYEYKLL